MLIHQLLTQWVEWLDLNVSTDDDNDDVDEDGVVGDDAGGDGHTARELMILGWGDLDDRLVDSTWHIDVHYPMDQGDDAAAHYAPYWQR